MKRLLLAFAGCIVLQLPSINAAAGDTESKAPLRQIIGMSAWPRVDMGSGSSPMLSYLLSVATQAKIERGEPRDGKLKVTILPQARLGDETYEQFVYLTAKMFNEAGAQPDVISLAGSVRIKEDIEDKILGADLILVGGGNTKNMLALFKAWRIHKMLKQSYEKGIPLSGISAGAICWFEQGCSDSTRPLSILKGMGLLKGSCCPHYGNEEGRIEAYNSFVQSGEALPGIALADYTAFHHKSCACATTTTDYLFWTAPHEDAWSCKEKAVVHVSKEGACDEANMIRLIRLRPAVQSEHLIGGVSFKSVYPSGTPPLP